MNTDETAQLLRDTVERLYGILIRNLGAIDSMHRVRLGPPGSYAETPEGIRRSFWLMFDATAKSFASLMTMLGKAHDDAKALVKDEAVARVIFQTVARQSSAFKPATATTFCGEAIERLHSSMLFYHRSLHRMSVTDRSDSDMDRIFRDCDSLWTEFGFKQGDFDELQRGLAWEFATVCDMQGWNANGGKPHGKTGPKKNTKAPRKRGRKPVGKVAITTEDKRIWHLHKEQGKSATTIAADLQLKRTEVQAVINKLAKRRKRISERKKTDPLTDF